MVTCYDYLSAKMISQSDIDAVLVGDSAAMVMHGFRNTVNAGLEMMEFHVNAVARGLAGNLIVADMPFLSHLKGRGPLLEGVDRLMKAGANAVKIEGAGITAKVISYLVKSDVPVMGHLGLTPQSVNKFGGFRIQGKEADQRTRIMEDARILEDAGVFAIVLEMIPADLAGQITRSITVPTIGIGAGNGTSGQILVWHDLLGMNPGFEPRFVRKYLDGASLIKNALNQYNADIKEGSFPSQKESF